jgi:hypothetical protein
MRTVRLLSILTAEPPSAKVRHYRGLPPELAGGKDTRQEMGPALFLVIKEEQSGIFLYRYSASGDCVGDTWHMSVDEAKDQAAYEYEGLVGEWSSVPPEVDDVVSFGLARSKEAGRA